MTNPISRMTNPISRMTNPIPIATGDQAGPSVPHWTLTKICLAGLVMLLACRSMPGQVAYIDDFAVGPQSLYIGVGDASDMGWVSGLDTNQLLWGSRSLTIQADQNGSGFRPLESGDFTLSVSGTSPGALQVQVAESAVPPETAYEPWIYLSYPLEGPAADWSAFDRIVIHFTAQPTANMYVQAWVNSDGTSMSASATALAGTNSLTFPFSSLLAYDGTPCAGSNITACSFSFSPPMVEDFTIGDIEVDAPPCLCAAQCESGLTLAWPTNAAGYVLQHSTNLALGFVPVAGIPAVVGTNYSVVMPCSCQAEFFSLVFGP
jgi:hypothetical protein